MLQIRWHGHSCFEITNDVTIMTDPHDGKSIGIPSPNAQADIILVSHDHYDHNKVKSVEKETSKIITDKRRKTIANIQIVGFESFHDECCGDKRGSNIIYKFIADDITFCHLGDIGHELDDKTIKFLGDIDVLFIPIGGTYTIDAKQAWKIISLIKPKIIIPMHYKIEGLSLPIAGIEEFLDNASAKIFRVGNEIDIEKEDFPKNPEVWVFTL